MKKWRGTVKENVLGFKNPKNSIYKTSDLAGVIRKTAKFLGKSIPEEKMSSFLEHLSFDKMKSNAAVNKADLVKTTLNEFDNSDKSLAFMRKGEKGNWKSHLTPQMISKFQVWEQKWLKGSDLQFRYD